VITGGSLFTYEEDNNGKEKFVIGILAFVVMIFTGVLFLGLLSFAYSTHIQVMNNVTTNEKIRKRWNAGASGKDSYFSASYCMKLKAYYWDRIPKSRIEEYFDIRNQAYNIALSRTVHSIPSNTAHYFD